MSQKYNTLTLKKTNYFLNNSNPNIKIFTFNFKFLKIFKKLLFKKGILVTKASLNFSLNSVFLHCDLFFRSKKIHQYKGKLKKIK
jgi:hypothetical protein